MKRSNRLILLIGVLLAAVAFVGIVVFTNKGNGPGGGATATPSTEQVVVAATDIKLGQVITASMVKYKDIQVSAALPDMYTDVGVVIGQTARANIASGAIIRTSTAFPTAGTATGQQIAQNLNSGEVAIAVQIDQVSGIGTLIQAGDRVDLIFHQKIQQYSGSLSDPKSIVALPIPASLSVKMVIQNVRVIGTELPPPTTSGNQAAAASPSPGTGTTTTSGTTSLNGQNEIVILAVSAQDAEAIRYQQLTGGGDPTNPEVMSLALRAPADASAPPAKTTGVVLQTLIQQYGMLVPISGTTLNP